MARFKSLQRAPAILAGIVLTHMIRKGQFQLIFSEDKLYLTHVRMGITGKGVGSVVVKA